MLYPKNSKPLTKELFSNPTSEYRGTPFWSWNCKLNDEILLEQIDILQQMGFGGFHMHVRTGMDTEYLSEEFMGYVKLCNEKAKKNKMLAWLYDEDRWPSGAAGGHVTKDIRYRERFLVFSPEKLTGFEADKKAFASKIEQGEKPKGYLLASYEINLDNGYLSSYKKLSEDSGEKNLSANSGEENQSSYVCYFYIELTGESAWFNGQTYANTLDKATIDKFIEVTHEKYFEAVGEDFSKSIPAIFTDEPQFTRKNTLDYPEERRAIRLPFTDDFPDTFKAKYGYDILNKLPEIIWELENEYSQARYHYHDHVCDRFVEAFAKNIGDWCDKHNIALTGHMMEEPSLESQTAALSEAMRSYPHFKLPGIDILCNRNEFSTAKQAQSVANQCGYEGVMSELYGVTHWDYDFKGHKLQGDWQAALGITIRVPHLSWMAMEGEAKRDYPASINYQSPWYKEYPLVENHYARLAAVLSRGKSDVKVAVIHPIESYWLLWGPRRQTHNQRELAEHNFEMLQRWLLFGVIDFDFVSEALLPSQYISSDSTSFTVGKMDYNVIIVPNCVTLRKSTVEILSKFREKGGEVIFFGDAPSLVDALPSSEGEVLYNSCEHYNFDKVNILNALQKHREVDILNDRGFRTDHLLHQLRIDGDEKWLFICHIHRRNNDFEHSEYIKVIINGEYIPTLYNTITGECVSVQYKHINGKTEIERRFYAEDSLLFRLTKQIPTDIAIKPELSQKQYCDYKRLGEPESYTMDEPNVYVLDIAQYSLNGEEYKDEEEILRLDNQVRERLGYPHRGAVVLQPWVINQRETPKDILKLRYIINSEIECDDIKLALEIQPGQKIFFNGNAVDIIPNGWFTDKYIKTVKLPILKKGENELVLETPFGEKTNIEWCYLLGNFGVEVIGVNKKIVPLPENLYYANLFAQKIPFYSGSITYNTSFESDGVSGAELYIPRYHGPVISVSVDGEVKGQIAFAPHTLDLGVLEKGKHEIQIKLFGNRVNSFGCLHNSHSDFWCSDPHSWRSGGSSFAYQYQFRPFGIVQNPEIKYYK